MIRTKKKSYIRQSREQIEDSFVTVVYNACYMQKSLTQIWCNY